MLFSNIISSALVALSSGLLIDSQIEKALQMATMDAAFFAERDFKNQQNHESDEFLSRATRNNRAGLCQMDKISMPYKLFIDKYVCPIVHSYLGDLCDGRGDHCVSCTSVGPTPETWDILKCVPNRQKALHTCSKRSMEKSFCENRKPKCPISFYSDFESSKTDREDHLCCMQNINLGQELACVANTEDLEAKKLALRLDFSPCRNPTECVPMNRQAGVRVNLDMYKPTSCCATLSWNR